MLTGMALLCVVALNSELSVSRPAVPHRVGVVLGVDGSDQHDIDFKGDTVSAYVTYLNTVFKSLNVIVDPKVGSFSVQEPIIAKRVSPEQALRRLEKNTVPTVVVRVISASGAPPIFQISPSI